MSEHIRIWRYRVPAGERKNFVHHYSTEGTWTQLFQRAAGYLGTTLWQDTKDESLWYTQDHWRSEADFMKFEKEFGAVYAQLDQQLDGIATEETFIAACDKAEQ